MGRNPLLISSRFSSQMFFLLNIDVKHSCSFKGCFLLLCKMQRFPALSPVAQSENKILAKVLFSFLFNFLTNTTAESELRLGTINKGELFICRNGEKIYFICFKKIFSALGPFVL